MMARLKNKIWLLLIAWTWTALVVPSSSLMVSTGPSTSSQLSAAIGRAVDLLSNDFDWPKSACFCEIIIDQEDAAFQRVGRVVPEQFPCDFERGTVSYQHFGSPLLKSDAVKYVVYSALPPSRSSSAIRNDSSIVTQSSRCNENSLSFAIRQLEIVVKHAKYAIVDGFPFATLRVNPWSDTSGHLITEPTLFAPRDSIIGQTCFVEYDSRNANTQLWPKRGQLVANLDSVEEKIVSRLSIPCANLSRVTLRYTLNSHSIRPDEDFIPLRIRTINVQFPPTDSPSSGSSVSALPTDVTSERIEHFWIPVKIEGRLAGVRPQIGFADASLVLPVNQLSGSPLGLSTINAPLQTASGTRDSDVVFHLDISAEQQLRNVGHFGARHQPHVPLTSFSQSAVRAGRLLFMPNASWLLSSEGPSELRLAVRISDEFLTVDENAEPYTLRLQRRSLVDPLVGSNYYVRSVIRLIGTDRHSSPILMGPDTLKFYATPLSAPAAISPCQAEPMNFYLYRTPLPSGTSNVIGGLERSSARIGQSASGDSSQSRLRTVDWCTQNATGRVSIQFTPSSGQTSGFVRIPLKISDGGSAVSIHIGLYLVTSLDRQLYDRRFSHSGSLRLNEGGRARLTAKALRLIPSNTYNSRAIVRLLKPLQVGHLVLRIADEVFVTVFNFTQAQLESGAIFYQHSGREIFRDQIWLVLDGVLPPPTATVKVRIKASRAWLPYASSSASLRMNVDENSRQRIGKKQLQYRDRDSLRKPPHFVDVPSRSLSSEDAGSLLLIDKDKIKSGVRNFTQNDISHKRIFYQAPKLELGTVGRDVAFVFDVVDDMGNKLEAQVFKIRLVPVNNQPPVFELTNDFNVREGGQVVLRARDHFTLGDRDTPSSDLMTELLVAPKHGRVLFNGRDWFQLRKQISFVEFENGRLVYEHDGSENHEDAFILRASDGLNSDQVTIPIRVEPVNDQLPEIRSKSDYKVWVTEGGVVNISSNIISAEDSDSDLNDVRYRVVKPPRKGVLLLKSDGDERAVTEFTQRDVQMSNIIYQHSAYEIGPNADSDSFLLAISDRELPLENVVAAVAKGDRRLGDQPSSAEIASAAETFLKTTREGLVQMRNITINIEPIDNYRPLFSVNRAIYVAEGRRAQVNGKTLQVLDQDTPPNKLRFFIVSKPSLGRIVLNNRTIVVQEADGKTRNANSSSEVISHPTSNFFTMTDLMAGHVWYEQTEHRGIEPTHDSLDLHVSDGTQWSLRETLPIVVLPVNDEPPQLDLLPFAVREGDTVNLTASLLVYTRDRDIPRDPVSFALSKQPKHGFLQLRKNGVAYINLSSVAIPLSQLGHGRLELFYIHDHSETDNDKFTLLLFDTMHTSESTVEVIVLPINDQPPVAVSTSSSVQVAYGGDLTLSDSNLNVTDADSDNVWLVVQPNLQFVRIRVDGTMIGPGGNFSREQLLNGDVVVEHWRSPNSFQDWYGRQSFRESITFHASDGQLESSSFSLMVTISINETASMRGSRVFVGLLNRGVQLNEGGAVAISSDNLSAAIWDGVSLNPDESFQFVVTKPPRFGRLVWSLDSSMVVKRPAGIERFNMGDLRNHRVVFEHTSKSSAIYQDHFNLEIRRKYLSSVVTLRTATFSITILPDLSSFPILEALRSPTLDQGSFVILDRSHLRAIHRSLPSDQVHFIIMEKLRHGFLRLASHRAAEVFNFTQDDVDQGRLVYYHDNSRSASDRLRFALSTNERLGVVVNGTATKQPLELNFQITLGNGGLPILIRNTRPTILQRFGASQLGFTISNRELLVRSSALQGAAGIEYRVQRAPRNGVLNLLGEEHVLRNVTRFKQYDVDVGRLQYIVTSKQETSDSVELIVTDQLGNQLPPIELRLSWATIEFDAAAPPTFIDICQNAGEKQKSTRGEIRLRRTGVLEQSASVVLHFERIRSRRSVDSWPSLETGRRRLKGSSRVSSHWKRWIIGHQVQIKFEPNVSLVYWQPRSVQFGSGSRGRLAPHKRDIRYRISLHDPSKAVLGLRSNVHVRIWPVGSEKCERIENEQKDYPGPPCTSANEGESEINALTGAVLRCNGTNWISESQSNRRDLSSRPRSDDPLSAVRPISQPAVLSHSQTSTSCATNKFDGNDRCYKLINTSTEFQQADAVCKSHFGTDWRIAKLVSAQHFHWLSTIANKRRFWIGAKTASPRNGERLECVILQKSGKSIVRDCQKVRGRFFCEFGF